MRVVRESSSQPLTIDTRRNQLGAGGEGTVYSVGGGLVAKIYKEPQSRREKILAMLANPPADSSTPDHDSIAWPLDALLESAPPGRFVGYLMKRVENAGGFREVAHFLDRVQKRPHFTNYELHVVALNIASAFSALHKKGYVVGDVNDRNILVTELGLATLLDTDSFQVPKQGRGGCFRCAVKTPEFTPPELQKVNPRTVDRRVEHDLFGLGVLIFQLLMQGNHPFNGSDDNGWSIPTRIEKGNFPFGRKQRPISPPPQAPPLSVLDDELGKLFVRCFDDGAGNPDARPTAAEWRRSLDHARQQLATCKANDHHRYPPGGACPWCRIRRDFSLGNGQGLDYFPDAASAQIPLAKPARGKVLGGSGQTVSGTFTSRRSLRRPPPLVPPVAPWSGSSSSSSGSTSTSTAGTGVTAPTGTGSTSSTGSITPTLGQLAWKGLGALASAYLNNLVAGSSHGQNSAVQDAIGAGVWELQRMTPVPPLTPGPLLLGTQVNLLGNGTFTGSGLLLQMYVQTTCQLSGQWEYNAYSNRLKFAVMVNGYPAVYNEELRILSGSSGQFQLRASDGSDWALRRQF